MPANNLADQLLLDQLWPPLHGLVMEYHASDTFLHHYSWCCSWKLKIPQNLLMPTAAAPPVGSCFQHGQTWQLRSGRGVCRSGAVVLWTETDVMLFHHGVELCPPGGHGVP